MNLISRFDVLFPYLFLIIFVLAGPFKVHQVSASLDNGPPFESNGHLRGKRKVEQITSTAHPAAANRFLWDKPHLTTSMPEEPEFEEYCCREMDVSDDEEAQRIIASDQDSPVELADQYYDIEP